MKSLICFLFLINSNVTFAADNLLDGRTYCRSIISEGMFGQPKGERLHCIQFLQGLATDNANTFFGSPPQQMSYEVNQQIVTLGTSKYEISEDGSELMSISGSTITGTILKLKMQAAD